MGLYDQNFGGGSTGGGGSSTAAQPFTRKIADAKLGNMFRTTGVPTPATSSVAIPSVSQIVHPTTYFTAGPIRWVHNDFIYTTVAGKLRRTPLNYQEITAPEEFDLPTGIPTHIPMGQGAVYNNKLVFMPDDTTGQTNDKIYLFDTTTLTWDATPITMPVIRSRASVLVVGTKLYLFGGYVGATKTDTTRADAYDFSTGTWAALTALPAAKGNAISVNINDKIYVVGGNTNTTATYEYNITTNAYVTKAVATVSLVNNFGIAALPDGRIYFPNTAITGTFYNTTTNVWSAATQFVPTTSVVVAYNQLFYKFNEKGNAIFITQSGSGIVFSLEIDFTNNVSYHRLIEGNLQSAIVANGGFYTRNNFLRTLNGKMYLNPTGGTGGAVEPFMQVMSRYLFELDLETYQYKKYELPETTPLANTFVFVRDGKVEIHVNKKLTIANMAADYSAHFVFDPVTKTFEKKEVTGTLPMFLDDSNAVAFRISGDKYFVKTGTGGTQAHKIIDLATKTEVIVGALGASFYCWYKEGDMLYLTGSVGGAYGVYEIDLVNSTWVGKAVTNIQTNAGTAPFTHLFSTANPFIVKNGLVFIFDITSRVCSTIDIDSKTVFSSEITFTETLPTYVYAQDGIYLVSNGEVAELAIPQFLHTSTTATVAKLIRGKVAVYDENNNFIGGYVSTNNIVDIPLLPGFKIRYLSGNQAVVLG